MKKNTVLLIFTFCLSNLFYAQSSTSLIINDTRAVNDAPNFIEHSIRADFKDRSVIGVPGGGPYSTNLTIAQWEDTDNSGGANHQLNFNNGGVFYRNAYPLSPEWGKWQQLLMTDVFGNVGIGTTTTGSHKLAVEGSIGAREIKVTASSWSDFVFKKEYNLPTLEEVEKHITEKGHLENIPSEEEVLKNGINLGEMNSKLLQKIEELTLYIIEMKKENQKQNEKQNIQIEILKKMLDSKIK
ncbi:hypothetical protein ACWA1F_13105 [Flavobacterium sp. 3-218]